MSSVNSDIFTTFFLLWLSFIYYSCLTALARNSSVLFNRSGKNEHLCLVTDLRKKSFQSFTIKYCVSCGFFIDAVYQIEHVLFYSLVKCFSQERILNLSNDFSTSIEMIMCFPPFILLHGVLP